MVMHLSTLGGVDIREGVEHSGHRVLILKQVSENVAKDIGHGFSEDFPVSPGGLCVCVCVCVCVCAHMAKYTLPLTSEYTVVILILDLIIVEAGTCDSPPDKSHKLHTRYTCSNSLDHRSLLVRILRRTDSLLVRILSHTDSLLVRILRCTDSLLVRIPSHTDSLLSY